MAPDCHIKSDLEKYYTCALETDFDGPIKSKRITQPHVQMSASVSSSVKSEKIMESNQTQNDDQVDKNVNNNEEIPSIVIQECCDDLSLENDNENIDSFENIENEIDIDASSTSSEEGNISTFGLLNYPLVNPSYGNPLAYSLHTIVEESCEEYQTDHESSAKTSRTSSSEEEDNYDDDNDSERHEQVIMNESQLEKYFSFGISSQSKRDSWSDTSDSLSESSTNADVDDSGSNQDNYDEERMSSSRLEKYFTSGLLGSGSFNYPDDVEFADESDCASSKENSLDPQADVSVHCSESAINDGSFANEKYDTVKRKSKEKVENIDCDAVYHDKFNDDKVDKESIKNETNKNEKENNKCEEEKEESEKQDSVLSTANHSLMNEVNIASNENLIKKVDLSSETKEKAKQVIGVEDEGSERNINEINDNKVIDINDNETETEVNNLNANSIQECNSNNANTNANDKVSIEDDVATFMSKLLSRMSTFEHQTKTIQTNNTLITSNETFSSEQQTTNSENKDLKNDFILSHSTQDNGNPLAPLKALESHIARLMKAVSPVTLSSSTSNNHQRESDASSTYTSSTIGSNNSDYGSDTLESGEYSDSEEDDENKNHENNNNDKKSSKSLVRRQSNQSLTNSGGSSDSTVSEDTIYICKQLMQSLKKLTEIAFIQNKSGFNNNNKNEQDNSEMSKARQYIRDQIVALMHTVQSSSTETSPLRQRRSYKKVEKKNKINNNNSDQQQHDCNGDSSDCGDKSPRIGGIQKPKKKPPSESGSETTCSASVSIPSYDDSSDNTPTESEISHEMEELFSMLESSGRDRLDHGSNCMTNVQRPSSDDDRASLKSWEARISLFAKVKAADESHELQENHYENNVQSKDASGNLPQCSIVESLPERNLTPNNMNSNNNKSQEITINGMEINQPNNGLTGHKTVVKIDENRVNQSSGRTDSLSPMLFDSLKDRSFSSDSVSSVQTVKQRLSSIATASMSEISSDGTQSTSRLAIDEDEEQKVDGSLGASSNPLRKSFNAKEKASSENNLLVANMMQSPSKSSKTTATTKSAGNISELDSSCNKSTFRDTGYYSFKSSEESIKSLDDNNSNITAPPNSRASSVSGLPIHLKQPKSETIQEVDEESGNDSSKMTQTGKNRLFTPHHHHQQQHHHHHHHHQYHQYHHHLSNVAKSLHSFSLSSSNIPDEIFTGHSRSGSLPISAGRNAKLSMLPPPSSIPHRSRSSFFSTSGVLRKLAALRGGMCLMIERFLILLTASCLT